ncbi:MAG: glycosyltransferase [Anaerolineae bacterium]
MRLLVVIPYYKPATVYGGPTHSVSALCEGLAKSGVQVTVMTTNANGPMRLDTPLRQPQQVEGVEVIYYPLGTPSLGTLFYSPELIRAARKKIPDYDLIGLEVMWTSLAYPLSRACQRQKIPYVISLRGQLMPWALRKSRLKKSIYWQVVGAHYVNGASALHCTDPVEVSTASQLRLRPPVFVVPNSLNPARFDTMPARGHYRRVFGIADEAKVLLFLGRLLPLKRPDIAIGALAKIRQQLGDVHLILAGPDEGGMGVN